jgi:hypothetical protein
MAKRDSSSKDVVRRKYSSLIADIQAGRPLTKEEWHRVNYDDMPERIRKNLRDRLVAEFPWALGDEELRDLYFNHFVMAKREKAAEASNTIRAMRGTLLALYRVVYPNVNDRDWIREHIMHAASLGWRTFYKLPDITYEEFSVMKLNRNLKRSSSMDMGDVSASWFGYRFTELEKQQLATLLFRGVVEDLYLAHKMMRRLPNGKTAPWEMNPPPGAGRRVPVLTVRHKEIVDYATKNLTVEVMLNEQSLLDPDVMSYFSTPIPKDL